MSYLPFPQLMDELCHYHDLPNEKETLGRKALRIEVKAMRRGKKDIAARIHEKYRHLYPKDDATLAFGLVFMSHLKGKQK